MKSLNLLVIFGACVTFSTLVITVPTSAPLPPELVAAVECQNRSDEAGDAIKECIAQEFTSEKMNETRLMYGDVTCIFCKHFCRKQDVVLNCVRDGIDILKNLSQKSQTMVPLAGEMIETVITSLCENDAEMLIAHNEDLNRQCFRESWNHCKSHVNFMDDLDRAILCDYTTPEQDRYTPEYICQKTKDHMECLEKGIESCSVEIKNSVTSLKDKIIALKSCAKYF